MAKKHSGPQWFKLYSANKALIDAVDDASAGRGLKLALAYFENGSLPDGAEPLTMAVFNALKMAADEAMNEYNKYVEAGKAGADKRYNGQNK